MRTILALTRKELEQYFGSFIAYGVVAFYLILCGVFFWIYLGMYMQNASQAGAYGQQTQDVAQSIVRPFLSNVSFFFLIIFPMLTMRLLAEEKKLGTYELLMTSPVSVTQMVLGKYLGAVSFMVVMLLLTGVFPLILRIFGHPDPGPIFTGFLGLFLIGSVLLAVGLFCSSITESQIIAAVLSFMIFLLLWVINWVSRGEEWYSKLCQYISLYIRFDDFTKGILNLNDMFYYVSFVFFALVTTGIVLQSQRWKS